MTTARFEMYVFPLLAGVSAAAFAGPTVSLEANASSKVPNDEMVVTVGAVSSGKDVGALNEAVLAMLNNAVKKAKAVPGVKTQLANVQTQPDWRDGRQVGWQVSGEVILTSQDMPALANLSGNLGQQMQIRSVGFQLSDAKRRAEETRLLKDAAANFRARAQATAQAFGYAKYEITELGVNSGSQFPPPRPMMMEKSAMAASASPVPAEGGNSDVTVTVTGRIKVD